jgi:hypothetical protein
MRKNQFDLETRKTECWGESYIFSKKILNYFRQYQRDKKNALILMPPDKYLIDKNVTFSIPEPAKFYYFTGLKSVRASSPLAEKANYVLVFEEEQFFMVPAENKDTLNNYLTAFRKYEITP